MATNGRSLLIREVERMDGDKWEKPADREKWKEWMVTNGRSLLIREVERMDGDKWEKPADKRSGKNGW